MRFNNRGCHEIRALKVTYDVFPYSDGSVCFEMGNTKVLVAVTLQSSVPHFLRGKKNGWLTAEYALLPASTHARNVRESGTGGKSGRSIEISRFIGRVLRSIYDLTSLGERSIIIDCDVLQADGSTRAACINGAYLALRVAEQKWLEQGIIQGSCLRTSLAAVSIGVLGNSTLLDLDYQEDALVQADFTFVCTDQGKIIEVQGTAEREPCDWHIYEQTYRVACTGLAAIQSFYEVDNSASRGGAHNAIMSSVSSELHAL